MKHKYISANPFETQRQTADLWAIRFCCTGFMAHFFREAAGAGVSSEHWDRRMDVLRFASIGGQKERATLL